MGIRWRKSLVVGIDDIDSQHRQLFVHIGELLDASLSGEGLKAVNKTVIFLEDYIHSHFATEENYMQRFDYPGYAEHKFAHDKFIKKFKTLKEALLKNENSSIVVIDTEQLLGNWWLNHIRSEDKVLGKFLAEKL